LLNDEELAQKMGNEARKTIEERFSQQQFVTNWDNIFQTASQICFRG
jgi:glycosyltransferase involved in cell wall biosynthesis